MGVNEIDFRGLSAAQGLNNGLQMGAQLGGMVRDNKLENEDRDLADNQRAIDDMARDAGVALEIQDEAELKAFLQRRVERIKANGGDPSDTLSIMNLPPKQLRQELQRVYQKAAPASSLGKSGSGDESKLQFGGQVLLKDEKGNLFYGTNVNDPSTGDIRPALTAVDGSNSQPLGKLSRVNTLGLTAPEQVGHKGDEAAAVSDAQSRSDLEHKPIIEAEITRARKLVENEVEKALSQKSQVSRFEQGREIASTLMPKGAKDISVLSKIYGKGESYYPNALRSQAGIDAIAERDRFVSMLALGARGELKGQGTITDSETKMLETAITILKEPDISPKLAARYITQGMEILAASAGRSPSPENSSGGGNNSVGRFSIKVK